MSKPGLLFSLSLHACLLLLLVLIYFLHHMVLYSLPQKSVVILNAYVQHISKPSQENLKPSPANPIKMESTPQPLIKPAPVSVPASAKPVQIEQSQHLAPDQIQQLLLFISKQIQTHLHYPEIAQTHVEQGQTVLQFDLTPTGAMQNIQIIQSSGNVSLDNAAIEAVQATSPISIPTPLALHQALQLRLPVAFNLLR